MNEIINELVDAIKVDERYLAFKQVANKLQEPQTLQLLNQYQAVLSQLNYLKQFDNYIDNEEIKQKLKAIKQEMAKNENIQAYYQAYYQINDLLQTVTELVFQNISDSLKMTGFKL